MDPLRFMPAFSAALKAKVEADEALTQAREALAAQLPAAAADTGSGQGRAAATRGGTAAGSRVGSAAGSELRPPARESLGSGSGTVTHVAVTQGRRSSAASVHHQQQVGEEEEEGEQGVVKVLTYDGEGASGVQARGNSTSPQDAAAAAGAAGRLTPPSGIEGPSDHGSHRPHQTQQQQQQLFAGMTAAGLAEMAAVAEAADARAQLLMSVNPLGPEVRGLLWQHVRRDAELEADMMTIAERMDDNHAGFKRKVELQVEVAVAQLMKALNLQELEKSSRAKAGGRNKGSSRGSARPSGGGGEGGEGEGGVEGEGGEGQEQQGDEEGGEGQEQQGEGRGGDGDDGNGGEGGEGPGTAAGAADVGGAGGAGVLKLMDVLSRAGGSRLAPFAVSLGELVRQGRGGLGMIGQAGILNCWRGQAGNGVAVVCVL